MLLFCWPSRPPSSSSNVVLVPRPRPRLASLSRLGCHLDSDRDLVPRSRHRRFRRLPILGHPFSPRSCLLLFLHPALRQGAPRLGPAAWKSPSVASVSFERRQGTALHRLQRLWELLGNSISCGGRLALSRLVFSRGQQTSTAKPHTLI